MARHLVIGNQTLLSAELRQALEVRANGPGSEIHVVVPQTPLDHYRAPFVDLEYRFGARQPAAQTVAEHQLDVALAHLDSLDATVTGEIGDPDPLAAARAALAIATYDEVIVSTLPLLVSKWLGVDLVSHLDRHVAVPVVHVECQEEPRSQQSRRRYDELVARLRAT